MLLLKIIVIIMFLFVIVSLFQALWMMQKGDSSKQLMSKFLGRRLLFSVCIFMLILVAIALGIITPNPRPY